MPATWLDDPKLARYAEILASVGVERGLIGPREVDRLWERHILNCAVVADPETGLVPERTQVADVGSGAGLPGLVWAIIRADLAIYLVEPLLRRATFLSEIVTELNLSDRVTVLRTRSEDLGSDWTGVDVVTARAVARLEKLVPWTLPLVKPGGVLLALKGAGAADELVEAAGVIKECGGETGEVVSVGMGVVNPATTVVRVRRRTTG